jgi:RNA polymerase sigma-70 factor (ECF subfamily)
MARTSLPAPGDAQPARLPAAELTAPPAAKLTALVAEHHAAVYRYACRLCGCPTEAEDLSQQAFLIAHQKLAQLREIERARGWLMAIVRSCYLRSCRKTRPLRADDLDLPLDQVADRAPEIDQIDREALAASLAELPAEFRVVVLMFYFEDLPYQTIATELEIPLGTVMSRLSRAKQHLRRRLEEAESKQASCKQAAIDMR